MNFCFKQNHICREITQAIQLAPPALLRTIFSARRSNSINCVSARPKFQAYFLSASRRCGFSASFRGVRRFPFARLKYETDLGVPTRQTKPNDSWSNRIAAFAQVQLLRLRFKSDQR